MKLVKKNKTATTIQLLNVENMLVGIWYLFKIHLTKVVHTILTSFIAHRVKYKIVFSTGSQPHVECKTFCTVEPPKVFVDKITTIETGMINDKNPNRRVRCHSFNFSSFSVRLLVV